MEIRFEDFNGAEPVFKGALAAEWNELSNALSRLATHLKASDQAGKQGSLIFDPVGTNEAIKEELVRLNWSANVAMPAKYSFLGTDVDFVKSGLLVEAQFSNYPFLLNNVVRSELLHKAGVLMGGEAPRGLVVITKAHMFPASNSTLYYEQGLYQLRELADAGVFDIPIRLVGLFAPLGISEANFTEYHNARYSRTVVDRSRRQVSITKGRSARSRCTISLQ